MIRVLDALGAVAAGLALGACTGGVGSTDTALPAASTNFNIGGTAQGLTGSGLVLQNDGADNLAVRADGSFVFPTTLITGNSYDVTVLMQPTAPAQTCVVSHGSGVVSSANVTGISVECTDKTSALDTIGGMAAGIVGSGLVLQDNGGDNLEVAANGSFTFATALPSGTPYNVTVLSPPIDPYQDCVIAAGTGTTASVNVASVSVSCKTNPNPAYTIGGTVSGVSGAAPLVLLDNGRDNLKVTADGAFHFAIPIPSGSTYDVTSLPLTGPQSETCTFGNASGTVGNGNVTNIAIVCEPNVTVTVSVSGLAGNGLVLQDNGGDNLSVTANGTNTFATALASGTGYDVTVLAQPTNPVQKCVVSGGMGTAAPPQVTGISVLCTTTPTYFVGGTLSGLPTGGPAPLTVILQDNAGAGYPVSANGPFSFPTPLPSGTTYAVTVQSAPAGYYCAVGNGSGTVLNGNVSSVTVTCAVIGAFLYVTNTGDNTISTFVVDGNSGALLPVPGTVATGTDPVSIVGGCLAGGTGAGTLYVANKLSDTLSAYSADLVSGALTLITNPPIGTGASPQFVDFAFANPACVPIALNVAGNTASSYVANPITGALAPALNSPTATDGEPVAAANLPFTLDGVQTPVEFIANKASNDVSAYTVDNNNGALALITGTFPNPVPAGTAPSAVAVQYADINGVAFPFIYVANQGSNNISEYLAGAGVGNLAAIVDPATGNPILAATGNGPTALAIVNYQNATYYVYVANAGDGTLSSYTINLTGTVGPFGELVPTGLAPVATGGTPLALTTVTLAGGTYLFVANSSSNSISVFSIDLSTGILTQVPGSPFSTGDAPTSMALQFPPSG